jgi:hypothetical protein
MALWIFGWELASWVEADEESLTGWWIDYSLLFTLLTWSLWLVLEEDGKTWNRRDGSSSSSSFGLTLPIVIFFIAIINPSLPTSSNFLALLKSR